MSDEAQCCQASGSHRPNPVRVAWAKIKLWIYLNIWCRYFYRVTMRAMHRFNIHHCPPLPHDLNPRYGTQHHWCQWCGLRGTTYKADPNDPLGLHPAPPSAEKAKG